jgi:hypothetical protein
MAKDTLKALNGEPVVLDVPANVKVKGEKAMRKNVVLTRDPDRADVVRVKTGKRGRPASLPVESIERTRAL